jgi:hypothetical protein
MGTTMKKDIAAQFKIFSSTLSTILKDRKKIIGFQGFSSTTEKMKRFCEAEHIQLGKCLSTWVPPLS